MEAVIGYTVLAVARVIAGLIGALVASVPWFLVALLFPSLGFIAWVSAGIGFLYGALVTE